MLIKIFNRGAAIEKIFNNNIPNVPRRVKNSDLSSLNKYYCVSSGLLGRTRLPPALSFSLCLYFSTHLSRLNTFLSASQDGGSLVHPAAERSLFSHPG